MSGDLTERLRDRRVCSPAQNSCRNDYICDLAADRIEELEAQLAEQVEWVKGLADDLIAAEGREARLKDRLAKATDVASRLYYGAGVVTDDMHATLAELTGGKDE